MAGQVRLQPVSRTEILTSAAIQSDADSSETSRSTNEGSLAPESFDEPASGHHRQASIVDGGGESSLLDLLNESYGPYEKPDQSARGVTADSTEGDEDMLFVPDHHAGQEIAEPTGIEYDISDDMYVSDARFRADMIEYTKDFLSRGQPAREKPTSQSTSTSTWSENPRNDSSIPEGLSFDEQDKYLSRLFRSVGQQATDQQPANAPKPLTHQASAKSPVSSPPRRHRPPHATTPQRAKPADPSAPSVIVIDDSDTEDHSPRPPHLPASKRARRLLPSAAHPLQPIHPAPVPRKTKKNHAEVKPRPRAERTAPAAPISDDSDVEVLLHIRHYSAVVGARSCARPTPAAPAAQVPSVRRQLDRLQRKTVAEGRDEARRWRRAGRRGVS